MDSLLYSLSLAVKATGILFLCLLGVTYEWLLCLSQLSTTKVAGHERQSHTNSILPGTYPEEVIVLPPAPQTSLSPIVKRKRLPAKPPTRPDLSKIYSERKYCAPPHPVQMKTAENVSEWLPRPVHPAFDSQRFDPTCRVRSRSTSPTQSSKSSGISRRRTGLKRAVALFITDISFKLTSLLSFNSDARGDRGVLLSRNALEQPALRPYTSLDLSISSLDLSLDPSPEAFDTRSLSSEADSWMEDDHFCTSTRTVIRPTCPSLLGILPRPCTSGHNALRSSTSLPSSSFEQELCVKDTQHPESRGAIEIYVVEERATYQEESWRVLVQEIYYGYKPHIGPTSLIIPS